MIVFLSRAHGITSARLPGVQTRTFNKFFFFLLNFLFLVVGSLPCPLPARLTKKKKKIPNTCSPRCNYLTTGRLLRIAAINCRAWNDHDKEYKLNFKCAAPLLDDICCCVGCGSGLPPLGKLHINRSYILLVIVRRRARDPDGMPAMQRNCTGIRFV